MTSPITAFPNGLSSFGIPLLGSGDVFTTGSIFFVDSVTGSDTNAGTDPSAPLATIDAAVNKCTANKGDYIIVMPNHAENIVAAAGLDLDVAGITIIGLGEGDNRPTLTFTTATTADVDVDAADVTIRNLIFTTTIDNLAVMIDVNAVNFKAINCEFREGASAQYLTAIDVNGGAANAADRLKLVNCKFTSPADGSDRAIEFGEIADAVEILGCYIFGDWDDAGIHNPTGFVLTDLRIEDCVVSNVATGQHAIELVSACTGHAVGLRLHADTPGVVFDPGALKITDALESHAVDEGWIQSPAGGTHPGLGIHVVKAAETLPATTQQVLFTVAGGRVLVMALVGEVTTIVQVQVNNTKVTGNPTTGTAVDLCAALDISGKEAGALFGITGVLADAMLGANAGALQGQTSHPVVPIGTIDLDCAATNTGATKWDLWYIPLDVGARVS